MIEYIKGQIESLSPTAVVIDCSGVGYIANISLNTYTSLQKLSEAKVLIYEVVREDAYILYGFFTERERELFCSLISVSGVGPNTARMILSSITPVELENAIASGNDSLLKAVKGIGAKTAQRIIVDLKDKIKLYDDTLNISMPVSSDTFEEAVGALVMLGFTQQQSHKSVKQILAQNPALKVEQVIKSALKLM